MSADLLQRLMEAGTPIALVAEVAERLADAQAAERLLEKRRAADRERKAVANPRIPRKSTEDAEIQGSAPSLDKKPPDPEKLNPSPCVRETRARDGYHRLPEGWAPTRPLPLKTQAKVDEWPPGAFEDELAALHRWAANAKNEQGKGRKRDWDKALVNWIERRHDEHYGRKRSGNGYQRDDRDPTTVALELLDAQDRARENAQAGRADFDERGGSGGLDQRGH